VTEGVFFFCATRRVCEKSRCNHNDMEEEKEEGVTGEKRGRKSGKRKRRMTE